ncbi:hypothetical protein DPQ33_02270 [Oceanidesulfovibrio indonesiensis]|uniref:Acyl-CoA reductase n=1 Tax=Oceanidesulfovibrio indonesiensis TaxID=54767 RepID=A0A7M3MHN9_9BACT|nr:acyl-CoA reductase [Oceanidesulfovibrio indonesiensis]TVM19206.1 hypothetical protein DPQ33_02270 [Oceanidesulfovibrio indonesiensis]
MSNVLRGYHLPGYKGRLERIDIGPLELEVPILTPDDVRAQIERLARGRETLAMYSVDQLAEIFGRAAAFWQKASDVKSRVATAVSALTGLSVPVVEASITVEQGNSSAADILAALDRELGNRHCLDGFVDDPNLKGMTRAFGSELVAAILTSNVPGLAYLPLVRAMMVKSPLAAKLSSREPVFGPAWMQSVAAIEPPLAETAALLFWSSSDAALEQAMIAPSDTLIVYGGVQSVAHFRETWGASKRIVVHGHKISLAMVGREALADEKSARRLAARLALDVVMFDQRACVSPQICYVETGGNVSTEHFAELAGQELAALESILPASSTNLDAAASLGMERNIAAFQAAQDDGMHVFAGPSHTVVHESTPSFTGVLPARYLRVCPVADLKEVIELCRGKGEFLQNVGLACSRKRAVPLAEMLARAGVSHITSPGSMHKPSMRWKHDGMACFADLVRYTDIEMFDNFTEE